MESILIGVIFNWRPKGATGAKGDKGDRGTTGGRGATAPQYTSKGDRGATEAEEQLRQKVIKVIDNL